MTVMEPLRSVQDNSRRRSSLFGDRRAGVRRGDVRTQARQVSLVRLLLITMGFGVLAIVIQGRQPHLVEPAATYLRSLLVVTTAVAVVLFATVWLARWRWQLALHLVFDLVWIGLLLHFSGGVSSPGVVLLFAVVLVGTLVLPGVALFVLPALASLVLAVNASLYLAGHTPFPQAFLAMNPVLTQTDRILGVLATQVGALFLVDLLGQLLARRLREQRIFTGEVLDRLGEGVLAVDRQGSVAYANAEAMRLLKLSGPVEGLPVSALLTDPALAPVLGLLAGDRCPALERFTTAEGLQLVLRVTELLDRREQPLGRTLIIADETRLRLLEDSAHRAEHLAALGEMAAGIAHEVRNPLTSLRGCAQEIAEMASEAKNGDAESLARIMVTEADRLARIVEDFLALSRLRSPEREPTELEPVIEELRTMTARRRDLPEALAMSFTVEDGCGTVLADSGQLRQVLSNLINNALDAMRQSTCPKLAVSVRPVDRSSALGLSGVEIAVADNGCGIPVDQRERVFTPFFSTKAQGTGLGLSLVQRIVREHEGLLSLTSEVGVGTTVTILLPTHSHTRVFKRALGGG
jgi:two-component system, NtrC family, sensor histidine kinase HydH